MIYKRTARFPFVIYDFRQRNSIGGQQVAGNSRWRHAAEVFNRAALSTDGHKQDRPCCFHETFLGSFVFAWQYHYGRQWHYDGRGSTDIFSSCHGYLHCFWHCIKQRVFLLWQSDRPPRRTTRFTDRNDQPAVKMDVESRPRKWSDARQGNLSEQKVTIVGDWPPYTPVKKRLAGRTTCLAPLAESVEKGSGASIPWFSSLGPYCEPERQPVPCFRVSKRSGTVKREERGKGQRENYRFDTEGTG